MGLPKALNTLMRRTNLSERELQCERPKSYFPKKLFSSEMKKKSNLWDLDMKNSVRGSNMHHGICFDVFRS